jgi:hypothetical protein
MKKKKILFPVLLAINYYYTIIKPNFQILNEIKAENNGVGIAQSAMGRRVGVPVPEKESLSLLHSIQINSRAHPAS